MACIAATQDTPQFAALTSAARLHKCKQTAHSTTDVQQSLRKQVALPVLYIVPQATETSAARGGGVR